MRYRKNQKKTKYLYTSKTKKEIMNRLPLVIMIIIIIFLITSLLSFITMEKVVSPEKVEVKESQSSTVGGVVKISIVYPEKEVVDNEGDIE